MNQKVVIAAACAAAVGLALACAMAAPGVTMRVDSHRTLGTPSQYKNLAVFPIYDDRARTGSPYMTLDEGLARKLVTVSEQKGGGSVNTLYITNNGTMPLYIMAGEVVLGGQQDRLLGRDYIIPQRRSDVPVSVYCVEHGRWTGHNQFAESAKTVAARDIRAAAQDGAFAVAEATPSDVAVSGDVLSAPGRARPANQAAGRADAQQKVWDRVAAKNRAFGARPATGTYREVLNMQASGAQQGMLPYVKALEPAFASDRRVVGVVAAINGKVVAADAFADPALFRKLWPKLLRSLAADAAEGGKSGSPATFADARVFLLAGADSTSVMESRSGASVNLRRETSTTLMYQMVPAGQPSATPVHENLLRK